MLVANTVLGVKKRIGDIEFLAVEQLPALITVTCISQIVDCGQPVYLKLSSRELFSKRSNVINNIIL